MLSKTNLATPFFPVAVQYGWSWRDIIEGTERAICIQANDKCWDDGWLLARMQGDESVSSPPYDTTRDVSPEKRKPCTHRQTGL